MTDSWYSRVKQIAAWRRKLDDLPFTITVGRSLVLDYLSGEVTISGLGLGVSFALHEIAMWLAEGVITLVEDVRITLIKKAARAKRRRVSTSPAHSNQRGRDVRLVDFDPQGRTTEGLGSRISSSKIAKASLIFKHLEMDLLPFHYLRGYSNTSLKESERSRNR